MLKDIEKSTGEEGLFANSAMRQAGTAKLEQKICEEMASKLGESFDSLACAATVKADIMEGHARIISTLTATNAELVAINKLLVAQLSVQRGRGAVNPQVSTPSNGAPGPATTSWALTTAGVSVPTTFNAETQKHYFNSKQACGFCKRDFITHVPTNFLHNPANKALLDAYNARVTARKAAGKV